MNNIISETLKIQLQAMEIANVSVVVSDMQQPNQPVVYCSKKFTEITGYDESEVIGKKCSFLQNNDIQKDKIDLMRYSFKEKIEFELLLRNYKKDGSLFYNILKLSPVFDNNNVLTHYMGIQHDVTHCVKSYELQNQLRQSIVKQKEKIFEEKIEKGRDELSVTIEKLTKSNLELTHQINQTKLLEQSATSNLNILNSVIKNFPNGMILVINEDLYVEFIEGEQKYTKLRDIFHLNENTFLENFKDTSLKEIFKDKIKRTLDGEQLISEVKINDEIFTINTTPLPGFKTKKTRILFIFFNITEQKKLSNKLKIAYEKEKELSELKTRFISVASHEFRTPLSAINLSATLIEKLNTEKHQVKRLNYVNRIKQNVKGLVTILDDFLSLGKIDEGKTKANFNKFDIKSFMSLSVDQLRETKKKGQSLILSSNVNYDFVMLDEKLLGHIIQNLLTNAIKFSPEDTEIYIDVQKNNNKLGILIRDKGCGIPEKEQDQLFDRFFRANNVTNIAGTGLGLNIAKQYVELMNGKITCKSTLNEGTTFILIFPNAFKF